MSVARACLRATFKPSGPRQAEDGGSGEQAAKRARGADGAPVEGPSAAAPPAAGGAGEPGVAAPADDAAGPEASAGAQPARCVPLACLCGAVGRCRRARGSCGAACTLSGAHTGSSKESTAVCAHVHHARRGEGGHRGAARLVRAPRGAEQGRAPPAPRPRARGCPPDAARAPQGRRGLCRERGAGGEHGQLRRAHGLPAGRAGQGQGPHGARAARRPRAGRRARPCGAPRRRACACGHFRAALRCDGGLRSGGSARPVPDMERAG